MWKFGVASIPQQCLSNQKINPAPVFLQVRFWALSASERFIVIAKDADSQTSLSPSQAE